MSSDMIDQMGKISQEEIKNNLDHWKQVVMGWKILSVFFNKGKKQGKLKKVEVHLLELTGYQQRFLMG